MVQDIVIVTFHQDIQLAQWCLQGLDKFLLTKTNIHLYINEFDKAYYQRCFEYLSPIINNIKNHQVLAKSYDEILYWNSLAQNQGYKSQQLMKLFHRDSRTAYLVMDPKDILINTAEFHQIAYNNWPKIVYWDCCFPPFDQFRNELELIYGHQQYLRGCLTPQLIDPRITRQILKEYNQSIESCARWFCSFNYPSEFFLYDYAEKFYNNSNESRDNFKSPVLFIRNPEFFSKKLLKQYSAKSDGIIIKLHRDAILDLSVLDTFQQWFDKRLSKKIC